MIWMKKYKAQGIKLAPLTYESPHPLISNRAEGVHLNTNVKQGKGECGEKVSGETEGSKDLGSYGGMIPTATVDIIREQNRRTGGPLLAVFHLTI